jgi:hypothetical protein
VLRNDRVSSNGGHLIIDSWFAFERSCGHSVMNLVQQGLIGWIAAPQGEALNALLVELDLAANQSVCPLWIDGNAMTEQPDMAVIIGAPEIDETADQWGIKMKLPSAWKWSARGCLLGTQGVASAMRADIPRGMPIQVRQTGKREALPYLGLPKRVESLDGVLEPVFQGRGEDRSHSERQAKAADAADGVRKLMGALETGVVIELGIGRQTQVRPALNEATDHHAGAQLDLRPGADLAPMHGHASQYTEPLPTTQGQVFDQIKAVQIDAGTGQVGQVPAGRRRPPALPSGRVLCSVAFENAVNSRHGGHIMISGSQLRMDRFGAGLAEHTAVTQSMPQLEDGAFRGDISPVPGRLWSAGMIGEAHSIQPTSVRSRYPLRHRHRADSKAACNRTYRLSPPHRLNHYSTPLFQ